MFATLGLGVDSSQMRAGIVDLQRIAQVARQAEQSTERLGREGQRSGRQVSEGARRARNDYSLLVGQARRAEDAIFGVGRAADLSAANLDRMATSGRRSGVALQNAGYQVGDFFVQVSAGTSATRALSQQLPQLLGGFGAAGAIIGATVAALGALAGGLFDAKDAAEELDEVTLDGIRGSIKELTELEERYTALIKARAQAQSDASDTVIAALGRELEARKTLYRAELAELRQKERAQQQALEQSRERMTSLLPAANVPETTATGISGRNEDAVASAQLAATIKILEANKDLTLEIAAQKANLDLTQIGIEEFEAALEGTVEMQREGTSAASDTRTEVERIVDAQIRVYENFAKTRIAANENAAAAEKIADELSDQIVMQAAIAKHGENSAEVAKLRAAAEREAFEEMLATLDVSEQTKNELRAARAHAEGLAAANIASGIGAGADEAARLAENLGISYQTAARIAALGPQGGGEPQGGRGGDPRTMGGSAFDWRNREGAQFLAEWEPPKASRGSSGGGGISQAERELEQFTRTLEGFRTEEQAALADLAELEDGFGRFHEQLTPEQVSLYGQAIDELRDKLSGAGEKGEGFFDVIESNMPRLSDLFRDGSNAIADMARSIVDMAFELNVLKPFFDMMQNGGLGGGGTGGGGGLLGGRIIPGILHEGGVAGVDGYGHGRSVSAAIFANAERYHSGGIAGLRANEVPAILERGERVIPANQSSAPNVNVTVIENATDGPTRVEQSGNDIRVLLRKQMQGFAEGGGLDGAMARRYGVRAQARGS